MSDIKLIASDLDGTLLLNGASRCNPEVFSLIEELAEKDVMFMAASGRQYQSLRRLFEPVKDKLLYLCENGALVIWQDQVLVKETFPRELALELSREIMAYPGCDILISGERVSYVMEGNQKYIDRMRNVLGNEVEVVESLEKIKEAVVKVAFYGDRETVSLAGKEIGRKFEGRCQAVVSGNTWLDFMMPGISKGRALRQVGVLLNIRPEEMAAFGDHENDRQMLEWVGHPYLMNTCSPTMRDMEGRVSFCDTVEEELKRILKNMTTKQFNQMMAIGLKHAKEGDSFDVDEAFPELG